MNPPRPWLGWLAAAALALALPASAFAFEEQSYASPDDALNSLKSAAAIHDTNALQTIFGPERNQLVSPDTVQASAAFKLFADRLAANSQWKTNSDDNLTLQIGPDNWPFPIPLVRQDGRWHFDTEAGAEEILARRVGMDELGAINVCDAYVAAQREYASQDRLGDGVLAYAQYLHSSPGAHDGLYWPAPSGGELSPLGPLIAQARVEGYHHTARMINDLQAPYHGYYFKILTRQGRHAPGGKYNYIINGRMIAGFALVAWPAEWNNTGVMTFIVNQQGKVFQKNLGPKTAKIAKGMTTYDPDATWAPAR